jgi:hypothetical protein
MHPLDPGATASHDLSRAPEIATWVTPRIQDELIILTFDFSRLGILFETR